MKAILDSGGLPPEADRIGDRRANTTAVLHGPLSEGAVADVGYLGGRPALWIYPDDEGINQGCAVLYLHGGAFEVGSPSDYQAFCSRLALGLGATVVALDYRLAPEHPFPAAVDDAVAAYRDLIEQVPSTSIAIIGDSAGGGLVLSCLIALRRGQVPQPAAAVALSPWADLTSAPDSRRRCSGSDPFIKSEMLQRAADQYLLDADPHDPLASPAQAPAEELAGLAPILIQAAGNEILVDDSYSLADRIVRAKGSVSLEIFAEAFHVWHLAGDSIPEARQALDSLCQFVSLRWDDWSVQPDEMNTSVSLDQSRTGETSVDTVQPGHRSW